MSRKTHTFRRVEGFNKALRDIPKEAGPLLRDASQRISDGIAAKAADRARGLGGVAKYIAPTIRSRRDRVPVVQMGGRTPLPPRDGRARTGPNQTVGNVIWGEEWGAKRYPQFPPPVKRGRMLWSTVADSYEESLDEWGDALMDAVDEAAKGKR